MERSRRATKRTEEVTWAVARSTSTSSPPPCLPRRCRLRVGGEGRRCRSRVGGGGRRCLRGLGVVEVERRGLGADPRDRGEVVPRRRAGGGPLERPAPAPWV